MTDPNTQPEMASEAIDLAETITDAVEATEGKSLEELGQIMDKAIIDYTRAYATHMSDLNVPETNLAIHIHGRSDSEIKVSYSISVYHSNSAQYVEAKQVGSPSNALYMFERRWNEATIYQIPRLTFKR